jgi:hypothetical protein
MFGLHDPELDPGDISLTTPPGPKHYTLPRWPQDYRLAMTELAKLFPTMRGVPGTDPWNVEKLISWLNSGAPTSGSWHAAMFLLGVWNPTTKWNQEGVRMRKGASGKFDLFAAYAAWDQHHIRAMQTWIAQPFWP